MKYLYLFVLIFLAACSSKQTSFPEEKELPGLSVLIDGEIEKIQNEHHPPYFLNKNQNLNMLLQALNRIKQYDIDSGSVESFTVHRKEAENFRLVTWEKNEYRLQIAKFITITPSNQFEIIEVLIKSKNDEIEFLTVKKDPMLHVLINDTLINPAFESRMTGINDAVKAFNEFDY